MAKRPIEGQYWIVRFRERLTLARRGEICWFGCEVNIALMEHSDYEIEPVQLVNIDLAEDEFGGEAGK
ncbi:hypothetical protein LCGC14_0424440 [marine sediment metagenome]|uniref:Uncharacterized protein n=1 Tax=marine sediment metagenome TaxID=412755 RepID=A0A0F9T7T6_9ZZZZ